MIDGSRSGTRRLHQGRVRDIFLDEIIQKYTVVRILQCDIMLDHLYRPVKMSLRRRNIVHQYLYYVSYLQSEPRDKIVTNTVLGQEDGQRDGRVTN